MTHVRFPLFVFVLAKLLVGPNATAQDDPLTRRTVSGPVTVAVSVTPSKPVIGDTLTLRIEATAAPDVEVLMPDFGEALDRFAILDFAPRVTVAPDGGTINVQTYRLDAPSSGRQQIPPILVEYVDRRDGEQPAPEGLDAYEVMTERIVLEVQSVLPQDVVAEIKPPLGELKPLQRPSATNRLPWIILIGVLVVSLPFVLRLMGELRRRARRRSAFDVADAKLQKLLSSPRSTPSEIKLFYIKLSFIVRRYIEDRYDMRAPELTTEEFLSSLHDSALISREHQALLGEFLKGADLVKFAQARPTNEATDRSIESVSKFLAETRENAPLLESDSSPTGEDRDG